MNSERIGNRIKERRKELHMPQEVLSEKSKVSRATISLIENGKCKTVLVSTLTAISSALDTNVEFFLT